MHQGTVPGQQWGERSQRVKMTRQVRRDLILDSIAEKEGLRATEADLDDRIAELAKKRNADPGQVYASLQKAGRLKEIEQGLTEEKVFKWLLERNTVE